MRGSSRPKKIQEVGILSGVDKGGSTTTITRIELQQFPAFEKLDLVLFPGINVFVGANGTGKTHVMKVIYSGCDITKTKLDTAFRSFWRLMTT